MTKFFLVLAKPRLLTESEPTSLEPANVRHLASMEVLMLNLVYFLGEPLRTVKTLKLLQIQMFSIHVPYTARFRVKLFIASAERAPKLFLLGFLTTRLD